MTPERGPAARAVREIVIGLAQTGAAAALALPLARSAGRSLTFWGTAGVIAALVATGHIYRRLRPRRTDQPPAWQMPAFDRPFARLTTISERVRWGVSSPGHFDAALRPMLTELADEQLRRRYGVNRLREPDKARALLGEPLWELVAGPPGALPTMADLEDMVRRIEEL